MPSSLAIAASSSATAPCRRSGVMLSASASDSPLRARSGALGDQLEQALTRIDERQHGTPAHSLELDLPRRTSLSRITRVRTRSKNPSARSRPTVGSASVRAVTSSHATGAITGTDAQCLIKCFTGLFVKLELRSCGVSELRLLVIERARHLGLTITIAHRIA